MATQLKKTVKPSGGDYTSLEACMNANEQDLVAADKYFDVEIDGTWTADDTTAVTVSGFTTDSTRYINIYTTSTARHQAVKTGNRYRMNTTGITVDAIVISSNYVTINGIEFTGNQTFTYRCIFTTVSALSPTIKNCYIHDRVGSAILIDYNAGSVNGAVYNNIICNLTKNWEGDSAYGIYSKVASNTLKVYNNTVYNATYGFYGDTTNMLAKNNIAYNCTTNGYGGTFSSNSTNNLSSDTSTPAYNTHYESKTLSFVDAANSNCKLASTDTDAIDLGADLSGESLFTDDILSTSRPSGSAWDIGADEYVSGGATSKPRRRVFISCST